jgi:septum formation protein
MRRPDFSTVLHNRSLLILASKSPRRREILTNAGIPFEVRLAYVPEVRAADETPAAYVRRLAKEKAEAVERAPGETVLAADTIVVADGEVLEKPADAEDAARMLRLLAGREHEVVTGICLVGPGGEIVDTETTLVRFVELSDDDIAAYVSSGEPMDKAGAYAIQGLASKFVDRVEGDYFNIVGLPVTRVYRHLRTICQS